MNESYACHERGSSNAVHQNVLVGSTPKDQRLAAAKPAGEGEDGKALTELTGNNQ